MGRDIQKFGFAPFLWVLVVFIAFLMRPLLPVDETRYLSVAWEMWIKEDFLVPHLNGEAYSHKPPLLFWLMHVGWWVFGVNEWWPRLIGPAFGLGCLFLTHVLALTLWPRRKLAAFLAPLVLIGSAFWALFTTLTMFDLILSFFTLVGMVGLVLALGARYILGFSLLAIGIGLGGLTKGPAILIHLLPVALLMPLWGGGLESFRAKTSLAKWYAGITLSILLGATIVLAWAIPAGNYGGEEYKEAIFWGQTAGRISESFAHQRSWWWYLPIFPVLVLPWCIWPPVWQLIKVYWNHLKRDSGFVFCAIWFFTPIIIFSMISGKQLHYLLPIFPAFALLIGYVLSQPKQFNETIFSRLLPSAFLGLFGFLVITLPIFPFITRKVSWIGEANSEFGIIMVIMSIWVFRRPKKNLNSAVKRLAAISIVLVITAHLVLSPVFYAKYDLEPLAKRLKIWQSQGYQIANFGKYHGQYNFLGRLRKPITVIGVLAQQKIDFLRNNPKGLVIAYYKSPPPFPKPKFSYSYRQMSVFVWEIQEFIKNPQLGDRRVNK